MNLQKFVPIGVEMNRQFKLWGIQDHHPIMWNAILMEEVGEVSQAILKTLGEDRSKTWDDVIEELVQVQAVAQSMIDSINRNQQPLIP